MFLIKMDYYLHIMLLVLDITSNILGRIYLTNMSIYIYIYINKERNVWNSTWSGNTRIKENSVLF